MIQLLVLLLSTVGVGGVVIQTPPLHLYQVHWLVSERQNFKFKVNASQDVSLYLGNAIEDNGNEITLGGMGNVYSCIRSYIGGDCFKESQVFTSPLTFGVRKDFWLFWNSTFLSIGTALNIGENVFLTYRSAIKLPDIHHIFIKTYVHSSGIWEIPDYLAFVTKDNLLNTTIYWDVAGVSSAFFSIETCGPVDIIFTTNLAHVYYKVCLGDCSNRCTTIQKVLSNNTESTPTIVKVYLNPLECSHYEDVWISWENTTNRLKVGTGRVLHQDVFVVMDNMENDAIVERMTIQSSLSAKWKIDVYGCELSSWKESDSWMNEVAVDFVTNRNRSCHCKRPSLNPSFDADFHCDSELEVEYAQKMNEPIKSNIWRSEGNLYSSTLDKLIITETTRIKCGVECGLVKSCPFFSYNKLNKACWLYDAQHFNINDFIENETFKTYISY